MQTAVFGEGCFWCTEAVFKILKGIISVAPGYSGGETENPTYEEVSSGKTGHAEAVRVEFDPTKISYNELLTVFFGTHDPTTKDRQGNDVGTQYRSVIFYTSKAQKEEAEKFIEEINSSNSAGAPVVTEVVPFAKFFEAEDYHRDFFAKNKRNPYCQVVINPKLEKVQKNFTQLLEKGDGIIK